MLTEAENLWLVEVIDVSRWLRESNGEAIKIAARGRMRETYLW